MFKRTTLQLFYAAFARGRRSAVIWSLLAIALRTMGGILVLPLVVRKLPSTHLGLWYVFLSLQGVASLFDLGFSPAVTRAAGYIWAGARELKKFGVATIAVSQTAEPVPNFELLNRLVATMRLYYRFFGVASGAIMLVAGGAWIWFKTQGFPDAFNLRLCYIVFVVGGFLNATGDLWPALLSGINGVRNAQKILAGSALLGLLVTASGLLANFGLWALVLGTVGAGCFVRWGGRLSFLRVAGPEFDRSVTPHFQLIAVLWPTAWRSGLVSLGGFLVLSANTLICSGFLTLETTASYGLSLALITMLTYASATFTQIKLPIVNQLRTLNQTDRIVELWIQRTRISLLVYLAGGVLLLCAGNFLLHLIGSKTMLLPRAQFAFALLIIGLEMHHSLYAGLIISENQNPFVAPALISGGLALLLSLILTPRLGVWGMLLAQGLTQAAFNNWWTVLRAIRGLGLTGRTYWSRYLRSPFGLTTA